MAHKQYDFRESLARIDSIQNQEVLQNEIPIYNLLSAEAKQMACTLATVIAVKCMLPGGEENIDKLRCKTTVLSEITAILMSDPSCLYVSYEGDTIIAVLNTPKKADIDSSLETVAKLNTLQNVLNVKFDLKNENKIAFGIGMVYGDVRFIPIPVNERINFMFDGDAVITAKEFADEDPTADENIKASYTIYNNLKEEYKNFFTEKDNTYTCNVINTQMNQWLLDNRK